MNNVHSISPCSLNQNVHQSALFPNSPNLQFAKYTMYMVFVSSMLSLGRILISDLVITNLFMYSLPGMLLLHLTTPFYTKGIFAWDICILTCMWSPAITTLVVLLASERAIITSGTII